MGKTSVTLIVILDLILSVTCEDFYYFAYGSNLLQKRLKILNPSAKFFSSAKLQDHRLDFIFNAPTWRGAVATIVEDPGAEVWGALWLIDKSDLENLDRQEGVHDGMYFAKEVTVTTMQGQALVARTYQQTRNPSKLLKGETLPVERQPSATYHEVIIRGAYECNLPMHYIQYLMKIPNNGQLASSQIRQQLGSPFNYTANTSLS